MPNGTIIPSNILRPAEVSKKIIAKPGHDRPYSDWFDHLGKYRDEHVVEYNKKKGEFLAAAKAYNRYNTETLMCRKVRLHANYEEMLNLDFLKEQELVEEEACDPLCCCPKCQPDTTGHLLRKRSLRHNITFVDDPQLEACSIEPWFKRHLLLHKFIWAARTVVIQNRLLKILKKLKELTVKDLRNAEKHENKRTCEELHCHPVFLKFL